MTQPNGFWRLTATDPTGRVRTLVLADADGLADTVARDGSGRREKRPLAWVRPLDRFWDNRILFTVTGIEPVPQPQRPAPAPAPAPAPRLIPPQVEPTAPPVVLEPPLYQQTQQALRKPDPRPDPLVSFPVGDPGFEPVAPTANPTDQPQTPAGMFLATLTARLDILAAASRTSGRLLDRVVTILDRIEHTMGFAQSDLDALAQALTNIDVALGNAVSSINADDSAIATELQALQNQAQAQGATLDLSGVQAAVAKVADDVQTNLGGAVSATTALLPQPAVPATPAPSVAQPPPAAVDPSVSG